MNNNDFELVCVYEGGDLVKLRFARSILESEGIPCTTQAEGVQDFFGGGRIGTGFNLITGPARLLVKQSDAYRATELLADLE